MDAPVLRPATTPTHPAPFKRRLRSALAWLHLWVGLTVGIVFAVVALSGSVLTFHAELLRWAHPQLNRNAPVADGRVLGRILDEWSPRGLSAIDLPRTELPVWQGYFPDGTRRYFAPEDGALLLERNRGNDALMFLHELHTDLLAGETGHQILGVFGWLSLLMLLSGLYLWWPKASQLINHLRWYRAPPVRRWLTWHRSSGAILFPVVFLVTLTGVGMVYHDAARSLLTALFGGAQPPSAPQHVAPVVARDWARILASAQRALPDARLSRLAVPKGDQGAVTFRARMSGEWHPNGRSLVFVDGRNARTLGTHDATRQAAGARADEAIYPLHIGSVGGAPYRWAVALCGVLPAFLLVTGFLFWFRRRAARGAARAKDA